ncbi:MAG: DUF4398 and OmpA-like domain-containing protein [Acidobacteria bacterium]|nr:DUF4398 and OmpA-like domain-containing protein [Acidobacteriota bacterium]
MSHTSSGSSQQVPIYQVKVIERTVSAVNYQYQGDPTHIDFRGTVLMPAAKGDAEVQSKQGRTRIDARFSGVGAPSRFGPEYLTYVLWAVTPEGGARNLGEVVADSGDRAHIKVTTSLQAFGMIVTAEPYSAVRQPGNVVVLENQVRSDTIGRIEPIHARFELLPRGNYTYDHSAAANQPPGPKVSMKRYESLLELYQAQNAIAIARSQGADRYAPDALAKADALFTQARQMEDHKGNRDTVVALARQAAQTAEDARAIASKRQEDEELARTKAQLSREQSRREAAEQAARQAQNDANQQQARFEAERAARERAEEASRAAAAAATPPPPATPEPPRESARAEAAQKSALRRQLLERMSRYLPAIDSPRGIVVTIPSTSFRGEALDPVAAERISQLATVIAAQPGLNTKVDGYSDGDGTAGDVASKIHADAVRDALVRGGLSPNAVEARGLGGSRPMVANNTLAGRQRNRRVEIVVSGDAIGTLANWDHAYSLVSSQR